MKNDLGQTSPQHVSNLDLANDGPSSQGESQTDGNTQGVPLRNKGMEREREREREEQFIKHLQLQVEPLMVVAMELQMTHSLPDHITNVPVALFQKVSTRMYM